MKRLVLILVFTTALFPQVFDWQDDGLPVRQGGHIEWQRTGDVGFEGEMIYAWTDTRTGERDIYLQKITADGVKQWGDFGAPLVVAPGRQEDPLLVKDGNGGAYVIWVDYRDEPLDGDVWGQHMFADGTIDTLTWGATGTPLSNAEGPQVTPNLCYDGNGGAFAIWDDQAVSNTGHIYAQHLSLDGPMNDPNSTGFPIITSDGSHARVSIETSGSGFANMAWQQDIDGQSDIYAQRIDTDLNTLWSTPEEGGIVVCDAPHNQLGPKINDMSAAISAIVWEDERNSVNQETDIYIQYVDSEGNLLLDPAGDLICDAPGSQIGPRVKADENSAYIAWADKREGSDWDDIYAQRHTVAGGNQWDDNGSPVATIGKHKQGPRLTTDGLGGVYIVWMDEREDSYPEVDVYIQHYTPVGDQGFEDNGLLISDAPNIDYNPLIRPDSEGGVMILWSSWRTGGSQGIFYQHATLENGIELTPNGLELYFATDGNGLTPQSLYLGNNTTLLYWTDYRNGGSNPTTFGTIIDKDYGIIQFGNGDQMGEDTYQENPICVLIDNHIFMTYTTQDQWGTFFQKYIILDMSLDPITDPEGTPVTDFAWVDQKYNKVVVGEDNFVYLAYSDGLFDYEVYVQKYDTDGNPQWGGNGELVGEFPGMDDRVRSVLPYPGGGVVVTWDGGPWDDLDVHSNAIDGDGDIIDDWEDNALDVSVGPGNQDQSMAVNTNDGIFIAWKDNRNNNADIYAQYITYDGTVQGVENGFPLVVKELDQQDLTLTYNPVLDQVFFCWQDYANGEDFDIFCNTFNPATLEIGEEFPIANTLGSSETLPAAFTSLNGSYMVAWEDTRNSTTKDIYYQEITAGELEFADSGVAVCDVDFKQEKPGIDYLNTDENIYVIYWDDSRSSGKEDLVNIYVQSRTISAGLCGGMDVNLDGTVDVLDIVMTVNYIMGTGDLTPEQFCEADTNLDETIDVLDVVAIVNYIVGGGN